MELDMPRFVGLARPDYADRQSEQVLEPNCRRPEEISTEFELLTGRIAA